MEKKKKISKKKLHEIVTFLNSLCDKYSNISVTTSYYAITLGYDFVVHIWYKNSHIIDTFMASVATDDGFDKKFAIAKKQCLEFLEKNKQHLVKW